MASPPLSPALAQWITDAVGSGAVVDSARRLPGATSSTLVAVDVRHAGRALPLVLRLFTLADWLAKEPDLARHEAASLRHADGAGIPVPELIALDETGAACGVPAVLSTRLPGRVDLLPDDFDRWLAQMAEAAAAFHAIAPGDFGWRYWPYLRPERAAVPDWASNRALWERAVAVLRGPLPDAPARFIHRDYHPT
ncbi:MAG: phosphotransferase, partial [Anaerolineae bacterium]|nr:phosphotransferase [Anaerolineae bacterium]